MNRNWIVLTLLILVVIFSGCVDQPDGGNLDYKDEALKMDTKIPDKSLPSQPVNMKVVLTNQVQNDINNISLRITDFYGLTLKDQTCSDGDPLSNCGFISNNCGCHFDNIKSMDDREINFVFMIPDDNKLARIGRDLKPEFTLNYDYWGENIFYIPILNYRERSTNAKISTTQTKGPIQVQIERGISQSSDQWEMANVAFPIIVWVKDKINPASKRTISKDRFNMTLINLNADQSGGRCDFNIKTIDDKQVLSPTENIELPMKVPLLCTLVGSVPSEVPSVSGMVVTDYDYNYTVVETKTITVETVIS